MQIPSSIRDDFPILQRQVDGKPLVYLDSSATSLKPNAVIQAVTAFYTECTANVHRSAHLLSEQATDRYEQARELIAQFINADSREIAFTKNATEALNLVAHSLPANAKVALTLSEHHSNFLPWQNRERLFLPLDHERKIDIEAAANIIREHRPALVSVASISNVLGVRQPVEQLIEIARECDAKVLIDLSQSVGHEPVDMFELDCDFACFSGHKMLGPSGVGVLYQREGQEDPITQNYLGGEMVHQAHVDSFEPRPLPWGLEAGTPNIEGVIGLGAAAEYLDQVGVAAIQSHVANLAQRLRTALLEIPDVSLLVPADAAKDTGIVTFHMAGIEAQGLAKILSNRFNIMIRSGFHCTQPFHEEFGLPESSRASLHLYNSEAEVDALVDALKLIQQNL